MKVCLIGEFRGTLDEGMRNSTYYLRRELSQTHRVMALDVRSASAVVGAMTGGLRSFAPDIIHYVPGPSVASFLITRAIARTCRRARTVMSVTHPRLSPSSMGLVRHFLPDLALVQSHATEKQFAALGCRVQFLPSGVDTDKFSPASPEKKSELRARYGLPADRFIALHVGHLRPERGIRLLERVQASGRQVLVVGSTSVRIDPQIVASLTKSGCIVWLKYFEHIEDVFRLSDCFLFPTEQKEGAMELPLTVLEAMSCNLPVVSMKFQALPRVFHEGDGLHFARDEKDFLKALDSIHAADVRTREAVSAFSWTEVATQLTGIYAGLNDGQVNG